MTRCPDCPRPEPLKPMTCAKSEIGNIGREFVKCQSKKCLRFFNFALSIWELGLRSPFQELDPCGHFCWMDKYIRDRGFQVEVLPPIQAPISSAMEEEMSRAVRPFEDFVMIGELQKLNKQLSKIVELKKQSNMMSGAFYVCIIAIYLGAVFLCRSD